MNKFFLYLVLILFLSNCGFKDKKVEQNPNAITLFEKSKPIEQELNPTLNIKISTITQRVSPFYQVIQTTVEI